MTKEIQLTQGKIAIVDDEDFEFVSKHKWCAHKERHKFYALTEVNGKQIALHRLLTNAPEELEVDHKDGNGLNCTRDNMRLATKSQNQMNRRKQENNQSEYKGVTFSKRDNKWRAQITINGIYHHLGYFDYPEQAAYAYDDAAVELFGEFATTNF